MRPYKVLLLPCVVNCTAGSPTPRLCPVVQLSVHWAPSRTTRVLVLAGARRCALETCEKKNTRCVCFMHALCSGFYYAETKIPNFKLDRTLLSNLAFDFISGVQRAFSSNTSQAQYNRTLYDSSIFTNQSSPVVR